MPIEWCVPKCFDCCALPLAGDRKPVNNSGRTAGNITISWSACFATWKMWMWFVFCFNVHAVQALQNLVESKSLHLVRQYHSTEL